MKISTIAMNAATTTELVPARRCSQLTASVSASLRNESSPLTTSAPTTAPSRLRDAADDEHRERQERVVEVDVRRDRALEVDEEAAREARPAARRW